MFDVKMDLPKFKTHHLWHFLIELKEFSAEDNSALFSEEQEQAAREREQAIMAERSAVPGMLKPSEIDSDLWRMDGGSGERTASREVWYT